MVGARSLWWRRVPNSKSNLIAIPDHWGITVCATILYPAIQIRCQN